MNGKKFKDIRNQLELSQEQLAAVLGYSGKQAICNIETGRKNPSPLLATLMQVLIELPKKRSEELREMLLRISERRKKVKSGGKR